MTVIASILAGLAGAAACWLVLRPALAETSCLDQP